MSAGDGAIQLRVEAQLDIRLPAGSELVGRGRVARPGAAAAQDAGPDDWIKEVKGTHRCLFDFPKHMNGMGLLHILNYLNTFCFANRIDCTTQGFRS